MEGYTTSTEYKPNIGFTIVYRIIALASGVGKTSLGEKIVGHLSKKGVKLAVVKQTHLPSIERDSDAVRYRVAGAPEVTVVSPHETLIISEPMVNLREIIANMKYYPLVIVEGFRGCNIGKAIAIIESEEELNKILHEQEPGLSLIVSHDFDLVEKAKEKGLHAILFDETESIAEWVYKDALTTLLSLLPGENCGLCRVGSCLEFAEKILVGEAEPFDCPNVLSVKFVVDNKDIPIDPKTEKIMLHIIKGILGILENVPESPKRITVTIKLKER